MPRSLSAFTLPVLIVAGSVVAGLAAGCSHPSAEPASPSPAAAPGNGPPGSSAGPGEQPPAASAAQVDEPPGTIACGRAVRAVRAATLMNPGVITDIAAATGTADAPVADAALALSAAYQKAITAHGTDAEPDAVAAVSAAAAALVRICADSGLETAG